MAVTYEVQSGENLESIARRFGTTTAEILRVNEIPDPQRLQVRTVIRIPVPVIPQLFRQEDLFAMSLRV